MRAALTKPLDWFSIQLARLSVHSGAGAHDQVAEAEALLHDPGFFGDFVGAPDDLKFRSTREFQFTSPVCTRWGENNTVYGRLYGCADRWQDKPTVVLLHGWNAETGYRVLFPYLAWRLARFGVNAVMFELPYHSRRKPRGNGAVTNFISGDLVHVVQATQQSIADARALVAWLTAQGCPRVGLWGISLGAWLGGLLACAETRLSFAALMTPVARMDRVIADLDFCEPIRRSLDGATVRVDPLNLATHRPKLAPEDILIVASEHDLFAPVETIDELWNAWGRPELWRAQHGHISVLVSMPVMDRVIDWVARKSRPV
jgi:dienelactone hydrolase